MSVTIETLIKAPKAEAYRRVFIKRRNVSTGLYEDDWFEITSHVKSFGTIRKEIDAIKLYKFSQGPVKLVVNNDQGLFNPHTSDSSLWKGYLHQQRTLFRIDAGFVHRQRDENGVWRSATYPGDTLWDVSVWDGSDAIWDESGNTPIFIGIHSGDLPLSDSNEVTFNIRPLTSVFEDFPAANLTGWTSTGMTASQFMHMLRDQTDGSGNFLFRPFFGNTTSSWDIATTSVTYTGLNTATASSVFDKSVWEIVELLAQAESFVPYVSSRGEFKFVSRSPADSLIFEFHGAGSINSEYGQTIKSVSSFGPKTSKYYSRVDLKYLEANTTTSHIIAEGSYSVSPASTAWVLGQKTLDIENLFIPNTATAQSITTSIFNEVSALKNEIEFTTTFVPHLDILDRIAIYYDPNLFSRSSLWDQNDWAEDAVDSEDDLIFDKSEGDAIILQGEEFRFQEIEIDLDNLQNRFIAREA